ncbi:LysR family transcriptional regulator [Kocuria palustris]|uniref:LysR family transcriptional regulator n=1 Tax=Kocuria palustris TaxID=71999 RepID=UPI0021B36106|nr:LysR family transcriptional regulator [Kocuria palustris]
MAETGTVTAGAARLGIGQPAASRQIQQLERRLRVRLFDRDGPRMRLTAAGRQLLPRIRELLQDADDLLAGAADAAAGALQSVRIAAAGTTRDDVLAPWLAAWSPEAPLASVVEGPVDELYPALRRGADLAVAPLAPPAGLASIVVAELGLWAYAPPGHPWAGAGAVTVQELARADLLLLERSFHARRRLDAAFEADGLGVEPLAEVGSPVIAQALAASGRGICVLSDDPRFGLVPLGIRDERGEPVTIRLHAAWVAQHHAAAALESLAQDLRRFARRRYPSSPAG